MSDNTNDARRSQGNRPAENARQATPSSLASQMNWQGGEEASDFLGLNEDAGAPQPVQSIPGPIAAPAKRATNEASWLMDGAEPAHAIPEEAPAHASFEADEYDSVSDAALARAPAVLDASWTEPEVQRGSRKLPMLIGAGVLGLLAFVGFQMTSSPKRGARDFGATKELAKADVTPVKGSSDAKAVTKSPTEDPKASTPVKLPDGGAAGRTAVDRSGRAVRNPTATAPAKPEGPATVMVEKAKPAPKAPSPKPKFDSGSAKAPATKPAKETTAAVVPLPPAPAKESPAPGPLPAVTPTPAPAVAGVVGPTEKPGAVTSKTQPTSPPAPAPSETATPGRIAFVPPLAAAPTVVAPAPAKPASAPAADPKPQEVAKSAPPTPAPVEPESRPGAEGVRVIGSQTQPMGDVANRRPEVDEHRTAVPTVPPKVEPVVEPVKGAPEVASKPTPEVAPDNALPVQPSAGASREGTLGASEVLLPAAPLNGVRAAAEKDMQAIWNGETVPMDRVDSPTKVLTPNVGKVRVNLKSNDVFEGRLYAVGENSVWIEGPFGRMGLGSDRVATVTRVEPEVPPEGPKDPKAAPANDRVRVKTANGVVLGKLLSNDGKQAKVVTDAGLKLTVDSKDVEHVDSGPKIVVKKPVPKS